MQTIEPPAQHVASTIVLQNQTSSGPVQGSEPVISVHHVSKQFGKSDPIVNDLNFEVQRGQIFCLLGASGSGKSTTMRMLTGVYKPSSGEVRVLGAEPFKFKKRTRTRMGYLPQQFVLFPELTTSENMNFMASVYGMSWFGRRKKVRQALEFVDLWDARNRLASKLSGGMQRRLELASVLVHQPELIFVDEPTAGIDPMLRAKFWEHFKSLSAEGRTLFVTTQYVTEADYCDVVAILSRGRLLALGTPESIRREAMGGELIDLTLVETTSQAVRLLRSLPGIHRIRTMSAEELRLTVDNATDSLKEILELFEHNHIEIQSIQPYRPDFEEVFVQLLEQDALANPEEDKEGHKHKDKDKNHKTESNQQPANSSQPLVNSNQVNTMENITHQNEHLAANALQPEQSDPTLLEQEVRQDPLPQPQAVPVPDELERRAEVVEAIAPTYRPNLPAQDEIVQPTPMSQAYPPASISSAPSPIEGEELIAATPSEANAPSVNTASATTSTDVIPNIRQIPKTNNTKKL